MFAKFFKPWVCMRLSYLLFKIPGLKPEVILILLDYLIDNHKNWKIQGMNEFEPRSLLL